MNDDDDDVYRVVANENEASWLAGNQSNKREKELNR
jgi:hypothetical protein